jgi:hypothetical protein
MRILQQTLKMYSFVAMPDADNLLLCGLSQKVEALLPL